MQRFLFLSSLSVGVVWCGKKGGETWIHDSPCYARRLVAGIVWERCKAKGKSTATSHVCRWRDPDFWEKVTTGVGRERERRMSPVCPVSRQRKRKKADREENC